MKKILFLFLFLSSMPLMRGEEKLKMRLAGEIEYISESVDAKIKAPSRKDKNLLDADGNPPCILKFEFTREIKGTVYLETNMIDQIGRDDRENGDVWFYVAPGAQNITLSCKGYEDLKIGLPRKTKSGSEFVVRIDPDAAKNQISLDVYVQEGNFISFQIEPKNVSVKLFAGAEPKDSRIVTDGRYSSDFLPYGQYRVEVSNDLYETYVETFDFKDKIARQISLKPAHNKIGLSVVPQSARTFIDGEEWKPDKLYRKGNHMIHVEAQNYAPADFNVTCPGDGSVYRVACELEARFGNVLVKCEDPEAEIWIDREYRGTGSWGGILSSLSKHVAEARKKSHYPSSIELSVESNSEKTFVLPNPYPRYGGLSIVSDPMDCSIYVDGRDMGQKTPYLAKLLVGEHKITLRHDGYLSKDITVNVTENTNSSISEKLQKGLVKVDAAVTFPSGTSLYMDNHFLSTKSPWVGKVDEGTHTFAAHKENHYPFSKKVTFVSGHKAGTVTMGEPTPRTGNIHITSNARGSVFLDGKNIGTTPLTESVIIGNHDMYVSADHYYDSPKESFSLSEGDTYYKDFRLRKIHRTPWLFREVDSAPHIVEFNYGLDDYMGLTYGFNKRHLGLFASGNYSSSSSSWLLTAGPTLNMGHFQLYGGMGGLYLDSKWKPIYTAGTRFQTFLGDGYNPVSFSAGVAFNNARLIPTFGLNVAALPYALYEYASIDTDGDFGSWFFGADMGVSSDEFFYGLFGEYCIADGMIGVYADYLHGTENSNAFAVGPAFRLIPYGFDMQLYGGLGSGNGELLKDVGMRFSFASGTAVSLWDFSLGLKWTDNMSIFNFSIGSVLSACTISVAALVLATVWAVNNAATTTTYPDTSSYYYYY